MAIEDFLITFRADTTQAVGAINALYQRVQQVDAQLNRTMGRQSNIAAPLTQMARAATPAAAAIGSIGTAYLQLNNIARRSVGTLTDQEKKARQLAQSFLDLRNAMTSIQASGRPVPTTMLDRAITKLEQLRGLASLTEGQIDALQAKLSQQFESRILVPEQFRNSAFNERQRRAVTRADTAGQVAVQAFGTPEELAALRAYQKSLQALGRTGVDVAAQIGQVRMRIQEINAAAQGARSIDQLNRKFRELDRTIGQAGGMTPANIRNLRDVLRQLQAAGGVAAGADPRAGRMLNIMEDAFRRLPNAIDPAIAKLRDFGKAVEEEIAVAHQFQTPLPSATRIANAFDQQLRILRDPGMRAGMGVAGSEWEEARRRAQLFRDELAQFPPGLDSATRSFTTHARRIAEGILLYDLFGRSIQAVSDQIKLVGDLAREEIRFEAVIGSDVDNEAFLAGISDVAERTNTQMADLASILDTVAVATLRIPDAADRASTSLQIMGRIGEFTNVTQRDLQTETENLIGIMSVFGQEVNEWEQSLGAITVMGRGSSRVIQAITDVLSGAGRAAETAGIDFNLLGALGSEIFQKLLGDMSGTEIASQLNTIFGKFADPSVQDDIEDVTNGIIKFRDESGNLRDQTQVFVELFAAMESGVLTSRQVSEVLDKIVPPLNPGARSFVEIMRKVLPDALDTASEGAQATGDDLTELSDKMVSGPAETFSRAIIGLQAALTGLVDNSIADNMYTIAGAISSLGDALNIAAPIAGLVLQLLAMVSALRLLQYFWKGFSIFLLGGKARVAEMDAAMRAAEAGTRVFGGGLGRAGQMVDGFFGKIRGLSAGLAAFARAAAIPIIITLVIESVTSIPDIIGGIQTQLDSALANIKIDKTAFDRALSVVSAPDITKGIAEAFEQPLSGLTPQQFKNVMALAEATMRLRQEGKLTAESFATMEEAVLKANSAEEVTELTTQQLIDAYNESVGATEGSSAAHDEWNRVVEETKKLAGDASGEIDELTDSEARLAEQTRLNLGLSGARADALRKLTEQLRNGSITVDEFSEGQNNIEQASEAAAAWVAAYGNQLSLLPGLQERVARTGETVTEALMGMLLDNPDTINERIDLLNGMVEIAETQEEVAKQVEDHPIEISADTEQLVYKSREMKEIYKWVSMGTIQLQHELDTSPIEPKMDLERLRRQAIAALRIYQTLLEAERAFNQRATSKFQADNPEVGTAFRSAARNAGAKNDALNKAIAELERAAGMVADGGEDVSAAGQAWGELGKIFGDDARLSGGDNGPQQTSLIDIGDLPASTIAQIVSIASQAQSRVVAAGGTVDTDETVAIFKDAEFQRLISGIDQRFLQQAIEELTEVERRRLELEQQRLQDVTRSMLVQTGPIQSLVSAPVLAAGGGVLTGQGLNADPRLGNFTINVPINWSGMSLTQLQQFIYESISKAWIDAQRGG